jgi:hypothetical protein
LIIKKLSPAAIRYGWQELCRRAGVDLDVSDDHHCSVLGIPLVYGRQENKPGQGPAIFIIPRACDDGDNGTSQPEHLRWLPLEQVLPPGAETSLVEKLPVIVWGESEKGDSREFVEQRSDGVLVFQYDLIAASVFMLSRWEEIDAPHLDEHGRFQGSSSTACHLGFLDRPIVDEYGLVLRAWLQWLLPGWQPKKSVFDVRLTHDIDYLRLTMWKRAHLALSDVLVHKAPSLAIETIRSKFGGQKSDMFVNGLRLLIQESRRYGFQSTFFFMATNDASKFDSGYYIDSSLARRFLSEIQAVNFNIGLHSSYASFLDLERTSKERDRMNAAVVQDIQAIRAHYLRVSVPGSWRLLESAGFRQDWSMGYSDQEGFRCGTCHPFPLFDILADRQMDIEEHPLIVMETTLHGYRGLDPDSAYQRIVQLAERCRRVEGEFVLIWHNTSFCRDWKSWKKIYLDLLPALKELVSRVA